MEIKLSDYQKALFEQNFLAKQNTEKAQEELLTMVFAAANTKKPAGAINYNNGILSWEDSPVEATPIIEG